ncbi:hypothetical protein ANCCEY_12028 [Ancylostoma ceylanicum]|uniref:Uncharacterized protein n=2 Tax=Ancylostoma ceylanicum TaxID=53326 RepID=A0A0D6LG51_9BILA|nr:hypothetical protein ANCCEY_12028 [Ancylostoma ceylanicum]
MESAGVLRNTHLENIWISRAFWIGYKPVPRYGAQLIQHTYQTAELSDLLRRADVTFMIQLVRKTMMVGAMRNYYSKRKYSMRPKEEKRDDVKAENSEERGDVKAEHSEERGDVKEAENSSVSNGTGEKNQVTDVAES